MAQMLTEKVRFSLANLDSKYYVTLIISRFSKRVRNHINTHRMKKTVTFIILSLILNVGYSQIVSRMYFGDYPFINRIIESNLNPKIISENHIEKVTIKGNIYEESKIYLIKYYNPEGELIKTKGKPVTFKSKLLAPVNWFTKPFKRKTTQPNISEIDSTKTGKISRIKYDGTVEQYSYNSNGNLTKVTIDYQGFSTAPKIKEIYLGYDSNENLNNEKVVWVAGESSITTHYYQQNQISRSNVTKYYFENIKLSKTEYTWRIADKPKIESFEYIYLPTGLLDYIKITDENQNTTRQLIFEYK